MKVFYKLLSSQLNSLSLVETIGMESPCESEVKVKVAQLCPTLCNPMDFIIRGILQATILE